MNFRKTFSVIMACTFLLSISPVNQASKEVQAANNQLEVQSYNNSNTYIDNKYDIHGTVYDVKQYNDCFVILTDRGLYQVKGSAVTKLNINSIQKNCVISKLDNSYAITPYFNNNKYSILDVDMQQNSINEDNIEKYIPSFDNDYKLKEVAFNSNNDMCFSVEETSSYGQAPYKLISVGKNGGFLELAKLDYAFSNLSFDKNNNVWFKYVQKTSDETESKYMLGKVSQKGEMISVNLNTPIINYKIAPDGSAWIISNNKIIHVDDSGNIVKSYDGENVKAIDIDSQDNIWIIDNGAVKKFEGDSFIAKYQLSADKSDLSIYKDGKLVASSTTGFTIIDGDKVEQVETRSNIEKNATALAVPSKSGIYNSVTVKILSGYEDSNGDDTSNNLSLRLAEKDIHDNFTSSYIPNDKKLDVAQAVAFNKDIFVPAGKKIYKLTDTSCEEYGKLNLSDNINENINKLFVDGKGNFIILGNLSIYKLNKDSIISLVDINNIKSQFSLPEDSKIKKIFKDDGGSFYIMFEYNNEKGEANVKFLNITDLTNIRDITPKVDNSKFVNAFVDESGGIGYVFYSYSEKKNKVGHIFGSTLMTDDIFKGQDENFYEKSADINRVKVTKKGTYLMILGDKNLYIKRPVDGKFVQYSENQYINNLVADDDGGFYVGSYKGEVLYFK